MYAKWLMAVSKLSQEDPNKWYQSEIAQGIW